MKNNVDRIIEMLKEAYGRQDNPEHRKITHAHITSNNVLHWRSDCDGWAMSTGAEKLWENHGFVAGDFIDLTEEQADELITRRRIELQADELFDFFIEREELPFN